jgi:multiple sugar transport system ATP-binding protein
MSDAVVQQIGSPAEVYHKPANLFVAEFIGSPGMNLTTGQFADGVVSLPGGNRFAVPPDWQQALGDSGEMVVGFRPEAAMISDQGTLVGEVYAADLHGAYTMLHVNLNEYDIVHIRSDRLLNFPIGTPVRFDIKPEMVRFFDPKTEEAVRRTLSVTRRSASE